MNSGNGASGRDHRVIGREMDLFAFDEEIGRGLPLWLPKGAAIREELEVYLKELEFRAGYQRVVTPHLARGGLYWRSGHLPYFAASMYPEMQLREQAEIRPGEDEPVEVYRLRPMNCPHHHKVFSARRRSYRELPLRLAEFGQVYRYEASGAVQGMMRVRGMCQNDAHIYCADERQAFDELRAVMAMYREVYAVLGIRDYRLRLSLRGEGEISKYVDNRELWDHSQRILREVLRSEGMPYFEEAGEAAFYGPKIDVQLRFASGREETVSTIQLDFVSADRFDLGYVGGDGKEYRPWIIHRAPLGTLERMVAYLLEARDGAFPFWLAPVQVRILPVSSKFDDYAGEIQRRLRDRMIRAEVDASRETLQKRIREASVQKIPWIAVVGERERSSGGVMLRRRGEQRQQALGLEELEKEALLWKASRKPARD